MSSQKLAILTPFCEENLPEKEGARSKSESLDLEDIFLLFANLSLWAHAKLLEGVN